MSSPSRKIIQPISGLRGLTVLSVVAVHFSPAIVLLLPGAREFVLLSNRVTFRMDLFFLLSGFITTYIYISLSDRLTWRAYRGFLQARLIRLYPSYLASLLLLIPGVLLAHACDIPMDGDSPFEVLPIRLALMQAWPYCQIGWSWNYPTWFLSALWFACLFVFPCMWRLAHRLRGSKAAYIWVFAPLAIWVGVAAVPVLDEFHMVVRASCGFVAGTALFVLFVDRRPFIAAAQKHLDKIVLGFTSLVLVISAVPLGGLPNYVNTVLVMATPLLVAGVTEKRSISARLLATRPLLWLGKHSYALFITHAVVQKVLNLLLPPEDFAASPASVRYLVFAAYCASLLGAAVLMRRLVEEPCASVLKRWLAESPPNQGGASGNGTQEKSASAG